MPLLNKKDVITYSLVDKEFPTCDLEFIEEIEWKEFNDLLGLDFYTILLADKADLSNIEEWDNSTQYNTNDIVKHENSYWIAIAEPEPDMGKSPTGDNGQWRMLTKFQTECYDNLWCKGGLARYLALCVIVQSIVPNATKLTAMGVVVKFGESYRGASSSSIKALEGHYEERRNVAWQRLKKYIQDDEGTCFDLSILKTKSMSCGCKNNCSCSNSYDAGRIVPNMENDVYSNYPGYSIPNVYQAIQKQYEIKPYNSIEEGEAQPEKFYYLLVTNEEGAIENQLQFNPNGTIHNI